MVMTRIVVHNYLPKRRTKDATLVGHKFKTNMSPNLRLEPSSEYIVEEVENKPTPFGNFANAIVKNTKTGKRFAIPVGNAQMMGYLPIG